MKNKKMVIVLLISAAISFSQSNKGACGIAYYPGKKYERTTIDSMFNTLYDSTKNNKYTKSGSTRSRSEIMKTVWINLETLSKYYTNRLKEKPGFKGKITVKFSIISSGDVIKSNVLKSTMNDSLFENQVKDNILTWKFSTYPDKNDTTEVVYPFVFTR